MSTTPSSILPAIGLAAVTALVGLAALPELPAQQPASWVELERPGGVDPLAVSQLGKLIVYREANELWVFSAFTRAWHGWPASPGATIRQANDWLLIRDGSSFTAFSSMRGVFQTLVLSPAAFVVNPASQRNDSILLVLDGSDLWAFSGFVGHWARHQLTTPFASIATERNVAVVAAGTALAGMSAYSGSWVEATALLPGTAVRAAGSVGVVENGAFVWCFSAQREAWQRAPATGSGGSFAQDDDVAVWCDAQRCLGFSGPRGEFAAIAPPAGGGTPQIVADRSLAVAADPSGGTALLYSGATGRWTAFDTGGPFTITTAATTALLETATAIHAYSALRDHVATLSISPAATEVNWTVVAAQQTGTGSVFLFSAFTAQWLPVPGAVGLPRTAFNAALVGTTGGGFSAFSARTGELVPLAPAAVQSGAFGQVQLRSGIVAVEDPQSLHVFEPRRRVWLSQPRDPDVLNTDIWRTSLVAAQTRRVFGYGSQCGEIEVFDLPEASTGLRASSECASVTTATRVLGFSPVPDLTTLWQFPEFRRLYGRGSRLALQLRAPAGAAVTAVLGLPVRADLPTVAGPIRLNPGTMGVVWSGVAPADGRAAIDLLVPDATVLSGLHLGFQGAVLPIAGAGYFTRMAGLFLP